MTTARGAIETIQSVWRRLALASLLAVAAAPLAYVARVVDQHTIALAAARRLLPRWDLATHLDYGWMDYHWLVTGQIHRLLWDLWLQGYWPPMLSIYQVPFYLGLGGGMASGLRSALAAFVLTGLAGSALLWRQWRDRAVLPVSLFLALLMSSPYLLAYASVTMTETLGALVQLVVLLAYVRYRQDRTPAAARLFVISLTVLFFTKYNYFLMLAVPLVLHEWIERTSGASVAERFAGVWRWTRRALTSPTVVVLVVYAVAVLMVMRTGGFDVRVMGRRISVHTIGNSGHIVLYLLLARLWYLHRHHRIDWARLASVDPLVRPLLVWFAVPVTIWLASPYPNHIRDVANLLINRPLGESTVGRGSAIYLDALRTAYFYGEWVLILAVAAFVVAAVRYRHQPPVMRWMILAIPLQLAAIAVHQTRFPRFLLLTVVLLCWVAASEAGRLFGGYRAGRILGGVFAPVVLFTGVAAAGTVVTQERFRDFAFENYTDNEALRTALDAIRADLTADDRLAIVGQGNEVSPALLRWQLGPPSGAPCVPFQIGGAGGIDPVLATRILLMLPTGSEAMALDMTSYYLTQRQFVLDEVARGALVLRRELPLTDMHVALRLYDRTSTPHEKAPCR
jgi:hypothetical protein